MVGSRGSGVERAYTSRWPRVGVEVVLVASFVSEARRSRDGSGPLPLGGCYN